MRRLLLGVALPLLSPAIGQGQSVAPFEPLSTHVARFSEDSLGVTRYVARRCAALYALAAGLSQSRSPDLAESLQQHVASFLALSVAIDKELGSSYEEAIEATEVSVSDIGELYRERARSHMARTGTYFASDSLVEDDMAVCRALVEKH